jgi:glucose/mannose transport system permease protein
MRVEHGTRVLIYLVLGLFAVWYLVPLALMLLNSVKPLAQIQQGNLIFLPEALTLEPWLAAWSTAQIGVEPTGLKPYFWNSIVMGVPAVLISTA